jgi:hypothetical protein
MRMLLVLLAATGLVIVSPAYAVAASSDERTFTSLVNGERTSHGSSALVLDAGTSQTARDWSARMARENRVYDDPNLGDKVAGWRRIGGNAGAGETARLIHDAMMRSAEHRANILGPYACIGVGVVSARDLLWVTEIFSDPCPGQPAASAPAAPPTSRTGTPVKSAPAPRAVAPVAERIVPVPVGSEPATVVLEDDVERASVRSLGAGAAEETPVSRHGSHGLLALLGVSLIASPPARRLIARRRRAR